MIIRLTTLNINLLFLFTIGLFLVSAGEYHANINIENVSKIILVILFIVIILNVYGISIKARIDTTQHSLVVLACQPKLTLLIGV